MPFTRAGLAGRGAHSHTYTSDQIGNAPSKVSVALSPTFEFMWKLAADRGSRPGSKSHCPQNAMSPSGTAAVTAVEDAAAAAAAFALTVWEVSAAADVLAQKRR